MSHDRVNNFITAALQKKEMVVCCGSGGVGKTTLSAALALHAAASGKKTLVLTIDPARRLANSLGMEGLGNQVQRVNPNKIREGGFKSFTGELHAMMLDCKSTFDALVERHAPSPQVAQNIINNRYYQHISDAMSGSHEYMAMEKLYELHQNGEYDLIVLDTPPTHNALDFLDAPNRLTNFLDDSVLKWFVKPYFAAGKFSYETAKRGSKFIVKILERVTGVQVLHDLSEFFLAFSSMYGGFKERAKKVREVLTDDRAAFLLVTSPNRLTIEECIFFYEGLMQYRVPFSGVIVNKFHMDYGINGEQSTESLMQDAGGDGHINPDLLRRLAENLKHFQILHEMDTAAIEYLKNKTGLKEAQLLRVPHFENDVYDLVDLRHMLSVMFDAGKSDHLAEEQLSAAPYER